MNVQIYCVHCFRRTLENKYQNIKENDVNNKNVLNMLDMERD